MEDDVMMLRITLFVCLIVPTDKLSAPDPNFTNYQRSQAAHWTAA